MNISGQLPIQNYNQINNFNNTNPIGLNSDENQVLVQTSENLSGNNLVNQPADKLHVIKRSLTKLLLQIGFLLKKGHYTKKRHLNNKLSTLKFRALTQENSADNYSAKLNRIDLLIKSTNQNELTKEQFFDLVQSLNFSNKEIDKIHLYAEIGNYSKALDKINECIAKQQQDIDGLVESTNDIIDILNVRDLINTDTKTNLKQILDNGTEKDFIKEFKAALKSAQNDAKLSKTEAGADYYFIKDLLDEVKKAQNFKELESKVRPLIYMHKFYLNALHKISEFDSENPEIVARNIEEIRKELALGIKVDSTNGERSDFYTMHFCYYKGLLEQKIRQKVGEPSEIDKKTAVIYTCSFGTGHKTTAKALEGYINEDWNSVTIDNSEDTFLHLDLYYKLTGKKSTDVFNKLLSDQKYKFITGWSKVQRFFLKIRGINEAPGVALKNQKVDAPHKRAIVQNLLENRPDMLITTYHMDLNPIGEVAKAFGVPLIHVATDMNPKMSEVYADNTAPSHPHFKVALPAESEWIKDNSQPLNEDQAVVVGFPVRPEFLEISAEEINTFKASRGIDENTKVVFVMGGGGGQQLPYPELMANDIRLEKTHVFVVAGNNNEFANTLQANLTREESVEGRIELKGSNPNVTVEILQSLPVANQALPYRVGPKEIALAMKSSHAAVIKPGGLSVYEALHSGCAIVADARAGWLDWEKENVDVVFQHGRGYGLEDVTNFYDTLNNAFELGRDEVGAFGNFETNQNFKELVNSLNLEAQEDANFDVKRKLYGDIKA